MGEGGKRLGRQRKDIFYLNNKRKSELREKVVILIDNLPQTGRMFLSWCDGNQFLTFPAKGMAFKVSCGGCNNRGIKLQMWSSKNEAVINDG